MKTIFMKRVILGDPPFKARKVRICPHHLELKAGGPHKYSETLICVAGLGVGGCKRLDGHLTLY